MLSIQKLTKQTMKFFNHTLTTIPRNFWIIPTFGNIPEKQVVAVFTIKVIQVSLDSFSLLPGIKLPF